MILRIERYRFLEVRQRQIAIAVIPVKQAAFDAGGDAIMVERKNVIDDPAAGVEIISAITARAIVGVGGISRPGMTDRQERELREQRRNQPVDAASSHGCVPAVSSREL
jgi:hypothetical protein